MQAGMEAGSGSSACGGAGPALQSPRHGAVPRCQAPARRATAHHSAVNPSPYCGRSGSSSYMAAPQGRKRAAHLLPAVLCRECMLATPSSRACSCAVPGQPLHEVTEQWTPGVFCCRDSGDLYCGSRACRDTPKSRRHVHVKFFGACGCIGGKTPQRLAALAPLPSLSPLPPSHIDASTLVQRALTEHRPCGMPSHACREVAPCPMCAGEAEVPVVCPHCRGSLFWGCGWSLKPFASARVAIAATARGSTDEAEAALGLKSGIFCGRLCAAAARSACGCPSHVAQPAGDEASKQASKGQAHAPGAPLSFAPRSAAAACRHGSRCRRGSSSGSEPSATAPPACVSCGS
eukprot:353200-Chlamydomonas_euryale.AAC.5